jgi:hypothetical protein
VAEAEQAVQGVKDAELRRIAFQKVLEELLGGGSSRSGHQVKGNHRAKKVNSKPPSKRKQPSAGPINYIRELVDEGFFKKTPRTIAETKDELRNHGHHLPVTSLSGPLQRLCQKKELRRHRDDGGYVYSNY